MAADMDMYTMAVDNAARSEDEETLRSFLPIAEVSADRIGHALYQAVLQRALGVAHRLAGEHDEAASQLSAAVEKFQQLDTPWQLGRTLLELGEVERSRGNVESAKDHFAEALSAFTIIGAVPYADRATTSLEQIS